MTHDELLASIDNKASYWHRNPLRAVVKLHKPRGAEPMWCGECASFDNMPAPYPCPTIEAIERELQ